MAITIPIISEFRDAGLKRAETEMQGFAKRAGNALRNLSVTQVAAAGAAIGAFAYKSVQAFQDLGLQVSKFSAATGLATEDASRWIEVAGDIGIEAGTVQSAIQRMNKTIGDGSPIFRQLGIDIAKTADGTVDASKTFQRAVTAIGAIEDPTLRASAAQQVFGKSYGEISRLMEMNATDLATALREVSDTKVFTREEVRQAEQFEKALDGLKDAAEELQIEIGQALVPALSDLAVGLAEVNEVSVGGVSVGNLLSDAFDGFLDRIGLGPIRDIGAYRQAMDEVIATQRLGGLTTDELADYTDYYASRVAAARGSLRQFQDALVSVDDAVKRLRDRISERQAWKDFETTLFYFRADTFKTTEELDAFALALADIITNLGSIPDETKVKLITELNRGDINFVLGALDKLRQGVTVPIRPSPTNIGLPQRSIPGLAVGGIAKANQPYMVGERGPELFVPTGSGRVIPNDQVGGSGMTVNITTSADPNEVIRAIEYYRRRNGTSVI